MILTRLNMLFFWMGEFLILDFMAIATKLVRHLRYQASVGIGPSS